MREGFEGQEWDCKCISYSCEGCKLRSIRNTIDRSNKYTDDEKKPLYHMLDVCEERWQKECKRTTTPTHLAMGSEEQLEFWHCTRCGKHVNECKCSTKPNAT